jgi:hypothetical protein
MMDRAIIAALCGSLLLLLGMFAPIVSTPPSGSMSYWQSGSEEAVLIVALVVATMLLVASGQIKRLLWVGIAALGVVGFTFGRVVYVLTISRRHLAEGTGDPGTGLAEAVFASAHILWGWPALILGSAMIIFAGWEARRTLERGAGKPIV